MVTIRIVNSNHPICKDYSLDEKRPKEIPQEVYRTLRRWGMGAATNAAVAYDNGKMVAFFRFEVEDRRRLYAYGTWVAKEYRGRGIAIKMWLKVLKRPQARWLIERVTVTAISRGGAKLVKNMILIHPEVRWKFLDYSR